MMADARLAVFLKKDEILENDAQRKIRRVDMAADVGDDYTHLPFFLLIQLNRTMRHLFRRTLSQDINRHAAVVLEGRAVDLEKEDTRSIAEALARSKQAKLMEKLNWILRMTEMEDLQDSNRLIYRLVLLADKLLFKHYISVLFKPGSSRLLRFSTS